MKRTALAVIVALGLTGCGGIRIDGTPAVQGSGKKATEKRQTGEFTGVVLEASADVAVVIGDSTSVVVEGDDNLLPLITTEVKDQRLFIRNRESYTTRLGIRVVVTTPRLEAAILSGSGSIQTSPVEADAFEASVPGSGELLIRGLTANRLDASVGGSGMLKVQGIKSESLAASLDGSGSIEIAGSANTLEASIAGSGNLELGQLAARDVSVSVSGSGNAEVQAAGNLDAAVSGSGSVRYSGDPKAVRKEVSGSGSVQAE
jgi:hypothetical protein